MSWIVTYVVRVAETADLDLFLGGWVEAWLFLPPLGHDVLHPTCKTGFIGTIDLDYSHNGDLTYPNLMQPSHNLT